MSHRYTFSNTYLTYRISGNIFMFHYEFPKDNKQLFHAVNLSVRIYNQTLITLEVNISAPRNSHVSSEQFLSQPILHRDSGKQTCGVPSSKPVQFPKSCCIRPQASQYRSLSLPLRVRVELALLLRSQLWWRRWSSQGEST